MNNLIDRNAKNALNPNRLMTWSGKTAVNLYNFQIRALQSGTFTLARRISQLIDRKNNVELI
ncbi:hypothetical protein, partial [Vibrio harveyi]|uniref:hypothetical protein n=1 Tax=Vibrio harveyi TaxID=669 RepID=UPI001E558823